MKAYRHACAWIFRAAKPRGWVAGPAEIDVTYRCCKASEGYKPRDLANAMSALKPAVDSMIDAGVIVNDSNRHLSWGRFRLFTRAEKGESDGVYIEVRTQ